MNTAPAAPLRLHHFPISGHVHRAHLMLSLLKLPFELVPVDLLKGQHKQADFLALNPFGQVPVLEDGDFVLPDSNAILVYLAQRYDASGQWWPRDPQANAQVQGWLSVAAGMLAQGPALARLNALFKRPFDPRTHEVAAQLFKVMEAHLASHAFLASEVQPTLADIAMYSYTARAPEGGVLLAPYPRIQRWLHAIEALPGFVAMVNSPVPPPVVQS